MKLVIPVLLAGCQYHVQMRGPAASASPAERVDAFMRLRPVGANTLVSNGAVANRTITLADDTEIVSPEDLEPLVGSTSETMEHARRSVGARHTASFTFWMGFATMAVGATLLGLTGIDAGIDSPWWVGTSVTVAGGILVWPVTRHYDERELEERQKAFGAYPRDLGLLLNVCAHGMQVVACDEPLAPDAPPSVPPKEPATTNPGQTGSLDRHLPAGRRG